MAWRGAVIGPQILEGADQVTSVYWLDGIAQAKMIRTKQISAEEFLEETIGRIDKINPALNAVIRTRFTEAREQAGADLPLSALSGVPMVLKDLLVNGSAELDTQFCTACLWRSWDRSY